VSSDRHRLRGVVALRRANSHADDGQTGEERPDVLAMAHDVRLFADAILLPHGPQPSKLAGYRSVLSRDRGGPGDCGGSA
jgi:hypothetical protein